MKKRIYALLLCLLLLAAFPLTAFAEEEVGDSAPELTIGSERTGNVLTVTVGIKNNSGIAGVDLALHFNGAVLAPSREPSMAGEWAYTLTNYAESFSGNTLKVVSVREENFFDDTLFTAFFTVDGSGSYGLSVSGTACAEAAEERIELATVFADEFGVKSVLRSGNSVTATVVSYGSGYTGSAKAILTCYQGGKFVGCKVADITVGENAATDVMFNGVSFSGDTLRLLLTDGSFTPLCAAVDVTS